MDFKTEERLEKLGWRSGDAADFLGVPPDERAGFEREVQNLRVGMEEYRNKNVVVLGATGFLGRAIVKRLEKWGAIPSKASRGLGVDLRDRSQAIDRISGCDYDLCINVSGFNGGINLNLKSPLTIFTNNVQVAVNAVEACAVNGIPYVGVVASCGYPDAMPSPLKEEWYTGGRPHETVACHGLAKRQMVEACRFAAQEYPHNSFTTFCVPTLFGPGDSFDLNRTKVVGAMVRRMVDAADEGAESVTCWGTGSPLREVLYVDDAAELILRSAVVWKNPDVLNLTLGQEKSIREIAGAAARAAGFAGQIHWDSSKADGQYRKKIDGHFLERLNLGVVATPFERGIELTIADYRSRKLRGEI